MMVKIYPGFGIVFLILFFIIIGSWMFISPWLKYDNFTAPNYGGLFFTAIGIGLIFTLKTISIWEKGIVVKYIVIKKEIKIPRNMITQITIVDRDSRYNTNKIKIEFVVGTSRALTLSPGLSSSYRSARSFFYDNYSELINEQ